MNICYNIPCEIMHKYCSTIIFVLYLKRKILNFHVRSFYRISEKKTIMHPIVWKHQDEGIAPTKWPNRENKKEFFLGDNKLLTWFVVYFKEKLPKTNCFKRTTIISITIIIMKEVLYYDKFTARSFSCWI